MKPGQSPEAPLGQKGPSFRLRCARLSSDRGKDILKLGVGVVHESHGFSEANAKVPGGVLAQGSAQVDDRPKGQRAPALVLPALGRGSRQRRAEGSQETVVHADLPAPACGSQAVEKPIGRGAEAKSRSLA